MKANTKIGESIAKESSGITKSFGISREGNDIIDNLLPIVASVYGDAYQYREKVPETGDMGGL